MLNTDLSRILIEVDYAIKFIQELDFEIKISEGQLSPLDKNMWVVTAGIYTKEKKLLSQGLSMGGGNRQVARAYAIFESLESLYFFSFSNPNFKKRLYKEEAFSFDEIFGVNLCSYVKNMKDVFILQPQGFTPDIINSDAKKINSTGWALGADMASASLRAGYEVIERDILLNLKKFSSGMELVNIGESSHGLILSRIAKEYGFELRTIIINIESSKTFCLCVLYDPKTKKIFTGTSFGAGSVSLIIKKSVEEVLMGFYFSYIAGNKIIGSVVKGFSYDEFVEQYDLIKSNYETNDFSSLLRYNFTYRVFSVQNKGVAKLFIAQALI